jgi:hypothetical protein
LICGYKGKLTSGKSTGLPKIDLAYLKDFYLGARAVNGGIEGLTIQSPRWEMPFKAVAEAFGTETNPVNFILCQGSINKMKGSLTFGYRVVGERRLRQAISEIRQGNLTTVPEILTSIGTVSCSSFSTSPPPSTVLTCISTGNISTHLYTAPRIHSPFSKCDG